MKRLIFLILSLIVLLPMRASNENIVIENLNEIYRIVPTKDGNAVKEIKNFITIDYRARRTAGNAVAATFYNDRISIDKASGGDARYGMIEDDDVFYSDSKVCTITLPLKKAGDKASARFERTFKDPKYFSRIALAEEYDVENYTVSFIIPNTLVDRLEVVDRRLPADAVRTVTSGAKETTVTYTVKDIKSSDPTSRRVPSSLTVPTIYLKGIFSDHDDLYRYLLSLVHQQSDPDSAKVAQVGREITAGLTTDSAKIAAVYDYVHDNIRYIAVEHGIYSHMPDLPSEVLRKRYGDCKGSAGLIRALLRGAGIDGRYVWMGTQSIPTEWTSFPMLCSGNHMIAAAITGDSVIYLDGTATYTPLGEIPTFIRGRQTLVEDTPDHSLVHRVPLMPADADSYNITLDIALNDAGQLKGKYHELMRGRYNSMLLGAVDATIESKRRDVLEQYLIKSFRGSRVDDVTLSRSRSGSTISAQVTLSNAVQTVGDQLFININPYFSTTSLAIDLKNRPEADAHIGSPFKAAYTTVFTIPEGYSLASPPEDYTLNNQWIETSISYSLPASDGVITMSLTLTLVDPYVPADKVTEYMTGVRALGRVASTQLHLIKN